MPALDAVRKSITAMPSSFSLNVSVRFVLVAAVEKWDAVKDAELHKLTLARDSTDLQLHANNTIVFLNTYKEYFIQ
ncbi:hypothetical protein EmuJ_000875200 [Echinococcus multilocularis]|uniref:Uncharacterized protein n=1 Tax=Echinococcus multilocularis TaxID=6211 RepID=A0A068Y9D3_ECHMU|nr:hypothetical protein EmuJ_000875200 [Echinococcus multilocularis]